jgi:hypothetical protein
VLKPRLTAAGRARLAREDVEARVQLVVRVGNREHRPPVLLVRLQRLLSSRQ